MYLKKSKIKIAGHMKERSFCFHPKGNKFFQSRHPGMPETSNLIKN